MFRVQASSSCSGAPVAVVRKAIGQTAFETESVRQVMSVCVCVCVFAFQKSSEASWLAD